MALEGQTVLIFARVIYRGECEEGCEESRVWAKSWKKLSRHERKKTTMKRRKPVQYMMKGGTRRNTSES